MSPSACPSLSWRSSPPRGVVLSGALQHEYTLGQSWIVSPAPLEDLRKAESEWARLAELVEQLKSKAHLMCGPRTSRQHEHERRSYRPMTVCCRSGRSPARAPFEDRGTSVTDPDWGQYVHQIPEYLESPYPRPIAFAINDFYTGDDGR